MRRLLIFVFCLTLAAPSFAKHIIGGVISYECLGGGTYRFTMKMYRDCSDPTGAFFDNNIPFTIYKGDNPDPEDVVIVSHNIPINDIEGGLDNPCLILPPGICVQEAVYEFEYTFADWPSAESYHLTYQRCCRNATVDNIQTPGQVGATFTIEVTPASQLLCNDSPVFEAFPPIVICAGEPLEYDHAAFDAQGDQLIYELCAPLIGAGQDGLGGGPSTPNYECDDLLPNPACPPPYETVQYVPPFSALNPLGGDPPVTIDPVTGLLYGTPLAQGQYSVGVCVYEYRNGQLLSVIRRDFQFNVVNCQPLYVADLQADTQVDDHYFIEKCEDLEISFENKSIQQATLDEYRWEFLIDGQIQTFTEWSPTITFPHAGNFEGALLLNPGAPCGDTAYITVTIFPEIVPDFTFEYDTCSAGPISYSNLSYIDGPGEFGRQFWAFGDADTSNLTNPVHLFKDPGAYLTRLTVEDTHGCVADTAKWVNYLPAPSLLIVSPNDTISCPPAEVLFNNLSSPVDESYKIFWDFGDGTSGTQLNPLHIYQSEGTYSVHLEIVSPLGCTIDTTFEDLIRIVPPPVADFRVDPPVVFGFNPVANFVDESIDAAHWEWYVNDQLIAHTQQVQNYMFRDTGLQKITLHITHPEKCQDTLTRWVDVVPEWTFYLPNAFTPNEDTHNDLFKGKGILTGIRDFDMQIWDRWGNQIFQTDDPLSGWNGRIHNTGRSAEEGVYLVRVTFTGPRGEPFEYQGVVTLFR